MDMPEFVWRLPAWLVPLLPAPDERITTIEQRMALVVELSRQNVHHGGGPFAAAVFELDTGRLVAAGVNLVVPANCSIAHAEMVAIALAQQRRGHYDLGRPPACELLASAEPCAMCLGAIPWSGLRRVVCGAREEDARAVGFDEGDKPPGGVAALERRGIAVVRDVLREKARAVLEEYRRAGGVIYHPRPGAEGINGD